METLTDKDAGERRIVPNLNYAKTVLDCFTSQVNDTPDAIAVRDGSVTLSYRELDRRANQLAHWLQVKGIDEGDAVALLFEPTVDFVICVLATVKVGAIYVPLDTKAPSKRLEYFISDSKAKLVITNIDGLNHVHLSNPSLHQLHQIFSEIDQFPGNFSSIKLRPDSPLCLFYTSGTTGNPKGILISHQAVVNLNKVDNFFRIDQTDIVAQFSNLAFDAITVELWSTLLHGATLIFVPSFIRTDNEKFKQFLLEKEVTSVFFPTSYFHQLIELAKNTVDSLRTIFFGGEAVNIELVKKFLHYRRTIGRPVTLINAYGPTETTTASCYKTFDLNTSNDELVASIGKPVSHVETYILDNDLNPVTPGEIGELYVSGINLAIRYLNSPSIDHKHFFPNPFHKGMPYERLYKTGDLVKELWNGELSYVGRVDDQIKVSGYRVYPSEIERQIARHPAISEATVLAEKGESGSNFLVTYLVLSKQMESVRADELSKFLSESLPRYMLPVRYFQVEKLPLNNNGKINKHELKKLPLVDLSVARQIAVNSHIEEQIKLIWADLLHQQNIDVNVNIFDLGADSLMLMSACVKINQALQCELSVTDILSYPTIRLLSQRLTGSKKVVTERRKSPSTSVAIIGMACRFPQAKSVQAYWDNICANRDCLTRFAQIDKTSNFIPIRGVIDDIDQFDAQFFGLNPVDASTMDPQQRVFLECAWEAFEQAGVIPQKNEQKKISAFCGMADSSYLQENLLKNQQHVQQGDWFNTRVATSIGTLATQISYRLNLNGTSVNINTACSTSLVAVAQACQDLMSGQSDIALAGAVSIDSHYRNGYIYQEGGIESADGQCRPFSEDANGTVFSDGAGVVILKRLDDAVRDNDTIYAVINGFGINNDGANKLGYTAPSVDGQTRCINEALIHSGLQAEQIGFIETHGTATALGDVIEFSALANAYRNGTSKTNYCALGSVKSHIGHTDIAAGMAGLIKTVLCLYHKKIPPTRHFKRPNPHIQLQDSPFYINDRLIDWHSNQLRYAGVSAFGIGGTNVHMILSEHLHAAESPEQTETEQLLIISGKTKKAQKQNSENLKYFLETAPRTNERVSLDDIAYTLQTGRHDFEWRSFVVAKNSHDAGQQLDRTNVLGVNSSTEIVFMFSGQGTQYPEMALSLLDSEPYFASIVEYANAIANQYLEHDLLTVIRTNPDGLLHQTQYTQPALFIIEYALAKLLMHYGVWPRGLIGHSIGEYVAACLAGVFSLEDAIKVVCRRGALMAEASHGVMLAINCSLEEFTQLSKEIPVELALHNSVCHCVAAGSEEAIGLLSQRLDHHETAYTGLMVSHAFHSNQMDRASGQLKCFMESITLLPPQIPVLSTVTANWLTDKEATSTDYWAKQLRQTVWFKEGIDTLIKENYNCFIEVGPGDVLAAWTKEIHQGEKKASCITHLIPNHRRNNTDKYQWLSALGELWQHGITINWSVLHKGKSLRRVSLPTYAFQRQRYWIEADTDQLPSVRKPNIQEWLYQPSWLRQHSPRPHQPSVFEEARKFTWIVFQHRGDNQHRLLPILNSNNIRPILVEAGDSYQKLDSHHFLIDVNEREHYDQVFRELKTVISLPPILVHLLSCARDEVNSSLPQQIEAQLNNSFYSALSIAQAYLEQVGLTQPLKYTLVTQETQKVLASDSIVPAKASLAGIHQVLPIEHPSIKVQFIDINDPIKELVAYDVIAHCMECEWTNPSPVVAIREGYRWERTHVPIDLKRFDNTANRFKDSGVYLFTGGLGGIAITLCEAISHQVANPTYILLSRRSFPSLNQWDALASDDEHSWQKTIRTLRHLQKAGAVVDVIQCDITNEAQLLSTVDHVVNKYGKLNGVIHAAGVAGGTLVQRSTKDSVMDVIAPKIHGTYYLAKAVEEIPLDFVMLCSSLASVIGTVGRSDYVGANACLDAFAESQLFQDKFVVSIGWNTWKTIGMAVDSGPPSDVEVPYFLKENNIEPVQAQQLFMDIMGSTYSNVAISSFDIDACKKDVDKSSSPIMAPTVMLDREDLSENLTYVAPTNSVETTLAEIWQSMLGIDPIGIEDDFFALGGHSFKALKFIEAANKKFDGKLTLQDLYKDKTIARLARKITSDGGTENTLIKLAIQPDSIGNIFLLHPVTGTTFCFDPIAATWDSPYNLYGLQDPSIATGQFEFSRLSDMAQFYLAKIKHMQPHGPYHLVGYSFGGTLAYEIAHLLNKQYDRVDLLALIDGWGRFSKAQFDDDKFKQRLQACYPDLSDQMVNLAWQRMKLLLTHTPSSTCQDMLLFKANQLAEEYEPIDDANNGWKAFNQGNIKTYWINGDHETIMSPKNVTTIFGIIKNALSKKFNS